MNLDELLKMAAENARLRDDIFSLCELELLEQPVPAAESPLALGGRTTWNLSGRVFGRDGAGGEFVLLDDGSVGWNSSEGETGRIAENLDDLFALLLNCSAFQDYLDPRLYESRERLSAYARKMEARDQADAQQCFALKLGRDYLETRRALAGTLSVPLVDDITDLLLKFHAAATREPQYAWKVARRAVEEVYRDNETETASGPLISRCNRWLAEDFFRQ